MIRLIFFVFLFQIFFSIRGQNSILSDGNWIKVGVTESAIFKIDIDYLNKHNISINNLNPNKIQIYGSGYNGYLPQLNKISSLVSPQEIPVSFFGNSDEKFDDDEFIYFFLQSSNKTYFDSISNKVVSEKNLYSDTAYYFISFKNENSLKVKESDIYESFDLELDKVGYTYTIENDLYNIIQSGRNWYGEIFSPGNFIDIPLNTFENNSEVQVNLGLVSRSSFSSSFRLSLDGNQLDQYNMFKINESIYGEKIIIQNEETSFIYNDDASNNLSLHYEGANNSISYLDFINISGVIPFHYNESQIIYNSSNNNSQLITKYNISSERDFPFNSDGTINLKNWDITDPYNSKNVPIYKSSNNYSIIKDDKKYNRNILFDLNNLKYPIFSKNLNNSNLLNHNSPDLLIISHKNFIDQANRIKALRESEGLTVLVTEINFIYDQFSSGNQDITSIRNYIKYIYNSSDKKLKYVLLFGDCSYDYKNRIPNNTNFIPIYQSYNSSNNIFSFSSDDYFGFLDEEEGIWGEDLEGDHDLEVGIGRIPSKNIHEAKAYVDKLYSYSDQELSIGAWKKDIYLVADDGDNNVHQNDAESHFNILNEKYPSFSVKKIYIDNYEQNLVDGVKTSLEAKVDLSNAIKNGGLIINYIGHGNEFFWAEEKIIDDNSIYEWENRHQFPLFITATCEFGKFDDPLITSGGEMLLNKENGGAIALFTTTRPVFSQSNFRLNQKFYENVFKKNEGKHLKIGDIFRITKNKSLSGPINRNFSLLGDPSLSLSYPKLNVEIEKIDTLRSGDKMVINGSIIDSKGELKSNFNGELFTELYDKISTNTTLGDESDPYNFREWDNLLFKGRSSITNGKFQIEAIIPVNIDYQMGNGKVHFFATDTVSFEEAIGSSFFQIGGSSKNFKNDNKGPDIELFIDSYGFKSGDIVSRNPLLIVDVFDESGINLSEKKSFQKILAIIDDTISIKLNEYFSYQKDSYQDGSIRFPIDGLSTGKHKIEIKISDNYNNLSTQSVVFIIGKDNSLKISEVISFPNPFVNFINFKFSLEEDQPIDIHLEIYDLLGNKIFSINKYYNSSSNVIDDLNWNGKDFNDYHLPQGIYIYKLHVKNVINGKEAIIHNKLIKRL